MKLAVEELEICFEGPGSTAQDRDPIPALLKAVARAHNWRDKLVSGEAKSVEALAREEGFNPRYFRRVLECAKLSPSIIETILAGRQPRHLTLATLYETVPVNWADQHL